MFKKSKILLFVSFIFSYGNLFFCLNAADVTLIPSKAIVALQQATIKAVNSKPQSAEKRRACKQIVRNGNALLKAYPEASNRFQLLGIMLQNQKIVVTLQNNELNRKILYDICTRLSKAPDEFAKVRLNADLLISDRDLTAKNASSEERAKALVEIIKRYRGSDAEAESLMAGAVIAKRLELPELSRFIEELMDQRFADDPQIIAFRRKVLSLKSLAVKCKGRYKRSDGKILNIPGDRIGHQCLLVYWSQKNDSSESFLKEVEAQRKRFSGMIEVYSLNLDELPDAGEKFLKKMGLDWNVMYLPNGKRNIFFQAYGGSDPLALFINAFGYTVLNPFGVNPDTQGWRGESGEIFKISETRLSHERYISQLQSSFIGDFLITDTPGVFDPAFPPELKMAANANEVQRLKDTAIPPEKIKEIQSYFILPPFRYRLSCKDAVENYRKADKLCDEILKEYPDTPDSWIVRNRRIIALMGLWNLLCNPEYLEQAVKESRKVLASGVSSAASVVARFCLAKEALRKENPKPDLIISKMISSLGGDKAPVSAFAAASVLALEANNRALHETYRSKVLSFKSSYPMWSFLSFLKNRYHRFYLLRPNTTRGDRIGGSRYYIVNFGLEQSKEYFPNISLRKLDGSELKLPNDKNGKLTLLLFIEPPLDPEADFPVFLDRNGKPTKNDYVRRVVKDATMLADTHINKSVEVIIAFICDDPIRVKSLMKNNEWKGESVMVPDGLKNPMIRRLGILLSDHVPNVFLIRRDGTIAWRSYGFRFKQEFGFPFAYLLAMKVHIEDCEVEQGLRYLEKGQFRKAAETFKGPFKPQSPDRFGWRSSRYHGLALSLMGLKDWKNALEAVDIAIDAHKTRHYRYPGRKPKNAADWRPAMSEIKIKLSCDIFAELWYLKSIILDELGQKKEAASFRKLAEKPAQIDKESPYHLFQNKLKEYRKKAIQP